MKIQVIGVCRFLVLVTNAFRGGPTDVQQRIGHLFAPARLAERFAWFEHVTLPSLRAQTDQDFQFVVLTSELLPDEWLERLYALVGHLPNFSIAMMPVSSHAEAGRPVFTHRIDRRSDVVAQFRIDDDDALGRDYVTRIRADFIACLQPVLDLRGMLASNYANGFIFEADRDHTVLYRTSARDLSCAQTRYLRPDDPNTLFNFSHHKLHEVMPTVTFDNSYMYARGRNGSNDSSFRTPRDLKRWDIGALSRRFGISLPAFQQALRDLPV